MSEQENLSEAEVCTEPIAAAEAESAILQDCDPLAALTAEKEALLEELSLLRAEHEALRNEYAARESQRRQQQEFHALYPEVELDALPDEVVAQTALPLAAAYALYERRQERERARAEAANLRNAQKSSGDARHDGDSDGEYSLEEIRRMSPGQVRSRYQTILHSLKKSKK